MSRGGATGPGRVASALVEGARIELALTPKPGLVDRIDNGSHPDLSYELMSRSIDLLPVYFDELLQAAASAHSIDENCESGVLEACVAAGRRAEERMVAEVGSNTHRGYIFLSGLVLLASAAGAASAGELRGEIAALARRVLSGRKGGGRRADGLAGIQGEALEGLPSVFDHALPALERGLARFGSVETGGHYAMAALMTRVEDTTAVHRCGPAGLARLRSDGTRLLALLEGGQPHVPVLLAMNDEYRAMRLTMGGVADCLAVTFALMALMGSGLALTQNARPGPGGRVVQNVSMQDLTPCQNVRPSESGTKCATERSELPPAE